LDIAAEPQRTRTGVLERAGEGPLSRRFLSGGVWAISGRLLGAGAAAALAALVTRMLSPADAGSYFLAASVVSIAAVLTTVGLPQAGVRLIGEAVGARSPGRAREIVRLLLIFGTAGAITGGFLIGLTPSLVRSLGRPALIRNPGLVGIWAAMVSIQFAVAAVFQGFSDIRLSSLLNGLVSNAICVTILGILCLRGVRYGYVMVITASIAGVILSLCIGAGLAARLWRSLGSASAAIGRRELFGIALPLLLTSLTLQFETEADLWILGFARSRQEVAVYAAARRLLGPVAMPLAIVNIVAAPLIAELYVQKRTAELETELRAFTSLAAVPVLLLMVVPLVWGQGAMAWVFGSYYARGAMALRLLSVGRCLDVLTGSCGVTLVMTGNHRLVMKVTALCGLLSFAGCLALVPRYGMEGVAGAVVTAWTAQNLTLLVAARIKTGMWTHVGIAPLLDSFKHLSATIHDLRREPPRIPDAG
jgi:O-antigen/teichoic acid export membrane protein